MENGRDITMGLFRRKKDKKAEEETAEPKEDATPAPEVDADGRPIKPEYLRASKVELGDVELAIDIKARAESRDSVLKLYEEKYGEKLDAPAFSAGLQYEYQLYEEGTYKTKRDLKDIEKAAKAGTEGEVKPEGTPPVEGVAKVEAAPATDTGTKTGGEVKAAPTKTDDKDKPKEKTPVAGESFFDPDKKINWAKSAFWCILMGKPFFPIQRFVRYKARQPKGWMYLLFILDLWEFPSWLWRLPIRGGYEGLKFYKKYKAKQAEEAAKAKEARKTKKAAEKAEKSGKATKA